MEIIKYDESVVLHTGEMDIDGAFQLVENALPMPEMQKKAILQLLTYLLCM